MTENLDIDAAMNVFALAAADAVRWWLTVDGPLLSIIHGPGSTRPAKSPFSAEHVESVAKLYGFRRTMAGTPDDDLRVAKLINSHTRQGTSLGEQARQLQGLVRTLHEGQIPRSGKPRTGLMVSGTTKLAWFKDPTGWTPFDSIAATGLKIPRTTPLDRMLRFYQALDMIGFLQMAAIVDQHIERHDLGCRISAFNRVRGERVVDRFLMFKGMEASRQTAELAIARHFVFCTPPYLCHSLTSLMLALMGDMNLRSRIRPLC
ncbi:hypothetical protein [Aureimonas ureilytica]|uniref:hypothetical protein n=1 Tax=Aureimonas ureilytica TaxID=401562 RepID=UPI0003810140|nr:hypothetical protein [Aureimonas ureilytica]